MSIARNNSGTRKARRSGANPDFSTFGGRLRAIRRSLELKSDELGPEIGVSRNSISAWENGAGIKDENLIALAKRLGVTPAWLKSREGPDPEPKGSPFLSNFAGYPLSGEIVEVPEIEPMPDAHMAALSKVPIARWGLPANVIFHWMMAPGGALVVKRTRSDNPPHHRRGDYLFIDTSVVEATAPGMYVGIVDGLRLVVIVRNEDGTLSATAPTSKTPHLNAANVKIEGRVVAVLQRT